jgi:hypothetical protein
MSVSIPAEYKDFLSTHGPFEGFIKGHEPPGYVALWTLEDLPANNAEIHVHEMAPGYLAFGGDGGGEVLAFDSSGAVFLLPMIGMESRYARKVSSSFAELAARFEYAV